METFWSELKFFCKRRVKAWDLFSGVLACAGFTYLLVDSVRNSITGIRLSHQLHVSAQEYYVIPCATFIVLLVFMLLTILKAISILYPTEDVTILYRPNPAGQNDAETWPPRPKPPK